jgi:RNA polymerase sigma factor (sigma-70 family)
VADERLFGTELSTVAQLVAGDHATLAGLYDRYSAVVYGLAERITGDGAAAESITQDVFTHIWRNPGAFDPERGTLRSWFCLLAHRRAVDWVRREGARRRKDRAMEPPTSSESDGPSTGRKVIEAAPDGRIRSAVDSLPTEARTAITLAYFDGLTYREVAQRLGIPESTAAARMRTGLRSLADLLEAEGITP